ncbi:YaaA family protein [bacterium]|nr:YaaA family protein [bacterium]MBU1073452.1 YaaA family protein [bacterium]MBU1675127.1 YaaA family protein [bacterium]
MIAWCTCCSAAKREDLGPLPALERYQDPRIHDLAERAGAAGTGFLILSGEYGLLRPDDPIPWYDHLLLADDVDELVGRVTGQLGDLDVTSIVFHTVDPAPEPQLRPYLETISEACRRAGVDLEIVTLPG